MTAMISASLRILFLLKTFSPSIFMYRAMKTGLITSATNSEDDRATISVIGRIFINSPSRPGHMASGKNAASVVAVEEIMGSATSPTPSRVASQRE